MAMRSLRMLVGLLGGALNALWITRFGVQPFIATLAMLFGARGLGLWLTNTRAMNMPDAVTHRKCCGTRWYTTTDPCHASGRRSAALAAGQLLLGGDSSMPLGITPMAAKKAGIRVDRFYFPLM
ncbi:MAG: hypothetical protein R3C56_01245 [Pirellulaceae bacterium]